MDEAGLNQFKFQMSVYYKYALDGPKLVVLSYVDECVYWYTYEKISKWFLDTLGKIFHLNFLVYAHWFMSMKISQLKHQYISVDKDIYSTSVVTNFLDTATIKEN